MVLPGICLCGGFRSGRRVCGGFRSGRRVLCNFLGGAGIRLDGSFLGGGGLLFICLAETEDSVTEGMRLFVHDGGGCMQLGRVREG